MSGVSATSPNDGERSELIERWRILAGCVLAMTVGVVSLPASSIAIFMSGLQQDFGWSRTAISMAPSIGLGILVLMSPVVGWIADRVPEVKLLAAGLAALGVSLVLLSRADGEIGWFLGGYALMMILASGASTVPLARIISANFERARGMALGIAMIGTGVSGFLLPLLLTPFVATHGWRAGFVLTGLVALAGVPLVVFLLRGAKGRATPVSKAGQEEVAGVSFAAAFTMRHFWSMAICFALITLATAGLLVHFLAMLTDAGVPAVRAGAIMSISGITLIVVRLVTGYLIDRIFAPLVAAVMMGIAGLCLAAFTLIGPEGAFLGAICYGLAVGAEIDLIGYLVARYFGMRAYGRIYGLLYAATLTGSALSPLLYGYSFDRLHSYHPVMLAASVLLIAASAMLFVLPRFPAAFGPGEDPPGDTRAAAWTAPRTKAGA